MVLYAWLNLTWCDRPQWFASPALAAVDCCVVCVCIAGFQKMMVVLSLFQLYRALQSTSFSVKCAGKPDRVSHWHTGPGAQVHTCSMLVAVQDITTACRVRCVTQLAYAQVYSYALNAHKLQMLTC